MVAALRCGRLQFQWYQLAYATEIKSIQLHDSIVRLSQNTVSFTLHYITCITWHNINLKQLFIFVMHRHLSAVRIFYQVGLYACMVWRGLMLTCSLCCDITLHSNTLSLFHTPFTPKVTSGASTKLCATVSLCQWKQMSFQLPFESTRISKFLESKRKIIPSFGPGGVGCCVTCMTWCMTKQDCITEINKSE